jgi:phosphate/sulfate permease
MNEEYSAKWRSSVVRQVAACALTLGAATVPGLPVAVVLAGALSMFVSAAQQVPHHVHAGFPTRHSANVWQQKVEALTYLIHMVSLFLWVLIAWRLGAPNSSAAAIIACGLCGELLVLQMAVRSATPPPPPPLQPGGGAVSAPPASQ